MFDDNFRIIDGTSIVVRALDSLLKKGNKSLLTLKCNN